MSLAEPAVERLSTEPIRPDDTTMKALVYHGPGKRAWEEHTRPSLLHRADAIVRVTTSTICGTDLHILKGDVPTVTHGRVLGHEGVGIVSEVGQGVLASP
jgi:alcohol dehydrogenase